MLKRVFVFLVILSSVLTTGCWNYRSLSDMSIVSGMAVDKAPTAKISA